MIALDLDTALAVLRKVHLEGQPLPPLAHAAGRSTVALTAELRALLLDLDRSVQVAAQSEGGRTFRIGARSDGPDVFELPAGCKMVPRVEPLAPVGGPTPRKPIRLVVDARGRPVPAIELGEDAP